MERQQTSHDTSVALSAGVTGELDDVRRRLVDRSLTILAVLVVPSAMVSVTRYIQHGWHTAYVVHWLIALTVILTRLYRRRLPFWFRTSVFLGSFAIAGALGVLAFGLSGLGLLFLAGFCILCSVVLGFRWGMIAVGVCTGIIVSVGGGLMGGWLSFAYDPSVYLLSGTAWLTAVTGFALATVLTIVITAGLRSALRESLDVAVQRARQLERLNRELDEEIREKQQSEAALQHTTRKLVESSERFRTITETALDSIFCKDRECRYTFVNPAMEALLEMPAAKILGRTAQEIFDAESAAVIAEVDRPVLAGEPVSEVRTLDLATGRRTFHTVQVPLRGEAGEVAGICGIVRDVTELTQAQQRSLELQTRLERAERLEALGLLAGGVAHDLNNILNPMLALPEQLCEDLLSGAIPRDGRVELPAQVLDCTVEALQMIRLSADRGALVIGDLMALSRRGNVTKQALDVGNLLRHCRRELEPGAQDARLVVDVEDGPLCVMGSESHLSRALANLVRNALESVGAGGTVRVTGRAATLARTVSGYEDIEPGDYVVIEVADTGHGIEPEDLKRIFEPFFTTKCAGEHSGSGIGLSIVHGVVKDHRGFVDVESTPGMGTTFTVYLPRCHQALRRTTADVQQSSGSERILVVDDEAGQRFTAKRVLDRLGYQVDTVADGHAAVLAAKQAEESAGSPYRLAVLDMMMDNGPDGLETLEKLRAVCPELRAVIASGHSSRQRMTPLQGISWLAKPYRAEDLAKVVRNELDR